MKEGEARAHPHRKVQKSISEDITFNFYAIYCTVRIYSPFFLCLKVILHFIKSALNSLL